MTDELAELRERSERLAKIEDMADTARVKFVDGGLEMTSPLVASMARGLAEMFEAVQDEVKEIEMVVSTPNDGRFVVTVRKA